MRTRGRGWKKGQKATEFTSKACAKDATVVAKVSFISEWRVLGGVARGPRPRLQLQLHCLPNKRPWASHGPLLGLNVPITLCKWGHRGPEKVRACLDMYTANQAEPSQNPGFPDRRLGLIHSHFRDEETETSERQKLLICLRRGSWLKVAKLRLRPRFQQVGVLGHRATSGFSFSVRCSFHLQVPSEAQGSRAPGDNPRIAESPG